MNSKDIKKRLKTLTGIPTSCWSRWTKYTVGSKHDMEPPKESYDSFMKGLRFGHHYPHLMGTTVRLFGGSNVTFSAAVAVFEKDDEVVDILDITGPDHMVAVTAPQTEWASILPAWNAL